MPLTDVEVRKAKPRDRAYKLSDGGWLYLFIKPNGAKLWRMDYRFQDKQRSLSIGPYPRVSLAEARQVRDEAKKLLSEDPPKDPSQVKRVRRDQARTNAANTFEAVADEYLAKQRREGKSDATLNKNTWLLRDLAGTSLGNRPVTQIEPPELLAVLRKIEGRGRYETARRLRSVCGQVWRYAIATGQATRDPSADLRGALTIHTAKRRAALLKPDEIGALLQDIDGYEGRGVTGFALKLAPLVFVRPIELRHAEWGEFELDDKLWRIPAGKLKMRREHIVPLSRQALAIIRELKPLTGHGTYLFPSVRSLDRPMSENTVNAALRRLGYEKEDMTGHGFRRMASTRLNEMGFNPDWIERQLAHSDDNGIRAIYNAAEWLPQRRKMMQAWADYLEGLKRQIKRLVTE